MSQKSKSNKLHNPSTLNSADYPALSPPLNLKVLNCPSVSASLTSFLSVALHNIPIYAKAFSQKSYYLSSLEPKNKKQVKSKSSKRSYQMSRQGSDNM